MIVIFEPVEEVNAALQKKSLNLLDPEDGWLVWFAFIGTRSKIKTNCATHDPEEIQKLLIANVAAERNNFRRI